MDNKKARSFFRHHGARLTLTKAYNPEALWADRTTHSLVTMFMPAELMLGQVPVMPAKDEVTSWADLPWQEEMT